MNLLLNELFLTFPYAKEIKSLTGGIENANFLVSNLSGDNFVVRIYLSKTPEEAYQEVTLLLSISNKVKCAKPILKVGNEFVFFIVGYPCVAFEYIYGSHPKHEELQLALFNNLGKTLGTLHTSTHTSTYRTAWNEVDTLQHAKELRDIFSDKIFYKWNSFIMDEIKLYETHLHLSSKFSATLHADIDVSNIILSESPLTFFLIDFDDSTFGAVELDLAITIRNLVLKGKNINDCIPKAEQLLKGYQEITNYHIKNFGNWVRFACFRHLVLMLYKSFQLLSYPSNNYINYLIWQNALKYENQLNKV